MRKLISQKQAIIIMIVILLVVLLFHSLILAGLIPYGIVWAGKISTVAEMRKLEVISILINAFAILILLLKASYIRNRIPAKILNAITLLFAALFCFNTLGNLFAESRFELYVFTPLTFILAVLSFRIIINKRLK